MELVPGNVIDTLIGESASADSVVLGSRGLGGLAGMVVGSVGMGVAGHATGQVMIVRGPSAVQHGRIAVGYDGSAHSEAAMQYAVDQARARGVELHVVYAWQVPMFSPYVAARGSLLEDVYEQEIHAAGERAACWREKNPDVVITGEEIVAHPVNALVRAGSTADLVVVGSRAPGRFRLRGARLGQPRGAAPTGLPDRRGTAPEGTGIGTLTVRRRACGHRTHGRPPGGARDRDPQPRSHIIEGRPGVKDEAFVPGRAGRSPLSGAGSRPVARGWVAVRVTREGRGMSCRQPLILKVPEPVAGVPRRS
ncbi:universal stress protein [Nonomuraea sp. 10N515B]|uniref:universal stress protein n=1 Tax=Nonomuraea sp. 10N515B TaxID=3457422 RepID=UPI003FCDDCDB